MPSLCFAFPMLFLLFVFPFYHVYSFHDDVQSLLAFKKLITIDPHLSMDNWTPVVPFCNWTAVTCSRRHIDRVVSINLTAMNLGGTISPYLGNLTFLQSLDLSDNALHGHIPTQLGRLFRLRNLWLHKNQLNGNIPQEMGSLTRLKQLYLYTNDLEEYGLGGTVSTQGDVYSYGILLLEMLSRKQPTSDMFVGDLNLYNWVNFAFPNRLKEVIDSSLFSEVDGDEFEENNIYKCLLSLLRVGLLCSKHSPEERPTMRVVVRMLEGIREDLVANEVAFSGLRRSISNLLYNTNATRNDALASDDQSSTF